MKKKALIIFTIFTICSLAACSKPNQKTSAEPVVTTGAETGTQPQETTTPAAEQTAPGNTEAFKILQGTVIEIADTLTDITVKVDGASLTFDLSNAMVETSYALDAEIDVNLVYKGEVSGTDTSGAKVILVLDAQDTMKVQTVTGTVTDQAMSTFDIQTEAGQEMGFLKDNCEGLTSDVLGQASGDSNASGAKVNIMYVTVTYDAGSESHYPLKVEAAK